MSIKIIPNDQLIKLMSKSINDIENIDFGNKFLLKAITFDNENGSLIDISLAWESLEKLSLRYNIGIHLMDNDYNIFYAHNYSQDKFNYIVKKGAVWLDSFSISELEWKKAKYLGLSIFKYNKIFNEYHFLKVDSENTDWENSRFIIKLSRS
jgi:hypothetical protein